MGAASKLELLELLEQKYNNKLRKNLNEFCRFVEIPGAPLVEDSCELGDDCDNPKCKKHEVSTAFYPDSVEPAEHHELINNILQKVAFKEKCPETGNVFRNVMFFMPPGSAKSTYATVTFPSWYMGNFPNKNIISTSYASGLARKFGRKVRSITSHPKYKSVFNTELNPSHKAVHDWSLENGASYMCGGILSGITGNRADVLLIDDPVKGREDADSTVMRDKTWEAYLNDLRTRLKPNGAKIIIQTRWHEDDLSGRILPENWNGQSGWIESRDGEKWFVVCLQAQCEREDDPLGRKVGEWLWTDWFTPEHWEQEKRSQGSRNWSALYQQCPKPAEGSIFQKAWFKRYSTPPAKFMRRIISVDTAFKDDELNDPSVFELWGETLEGEYYLLDVWKDRVLYPDLKKNFYNFVLKNGGDSAIVEDKASGQSLIQEIRHGLQIAGRPRRWHFPISAIEPDGSKLERAIRVSPLVESGRVYLPNSAPWLIDFESEVFGFPLSTHDDQVDAMTQFLEYAFKTAHGIQIAGSGERESVSNRPSRSQVREEDTSDSIGSDLDFYDF